MDKRVEFYCDFCKKRCKRYNFWFKQSKHHYCSVKCAILARPNGQVEKTCPNCQTRFIVWKSHTNQRCCSFKCAGKYKTRGKIKCKCQLCKKEIGRYPSVFNLHKKHFCSRLHASQWHNKYRKSQRSYLEIWIEEQIKKSFNKLPCLFNSRTAITGELDIFFPTLKLAFELNGPAHYKPIYGSAKLKYMQEKDRKKLAECQEKGIQLEVLNTCGQRHFNPETSYPYLRQIMELVKQKV